MRTCSVDKCGRTREARAKEDEDGRRDGGCGRGRVSVVGIGPGAIEHLTPKARQEIERADILVGYATYVKLVSPIIRPGTEVVSGGMGGEVERAKIAVRMALNGKHVAVVSGGDPGVYGMAGVVLEVAALVGAAVPIEVVPGITAATAAAAKLGAPIVGDFAAISLSDLLTPWEVIERRLEAAAETDFIIVLYNPQSSGRKDPLTRAHGVLLRHRGPEVPVGIVRMAEREGEETTVTTLGSMLEAEIDMGTTVIVGNSSTKIINGRMVTPRGYDLLRARR